MKNLLCRKRSILLCICLYGVFTFRALFNDIMFGYLATTPTTMETPWKPPSLKDLEDSNGEFIDFNDNEKYTKNRRANNVTNDLNHHLKKEQLKYSTNSMKPSNSLKRSNKNVRFEHFWDHMKKKQNNKLKASITSEETNQKLTLEPRDHENNKEDPYGKEEQDKQIENDQNSEDHTMPALKGELETGSPAELVDATDTARNNLVKKENTSTNLHVKTMGNKELTPAKIDTESKGKVDDSNTKGVPTSTAKTPDEKSSTMKNKDNRAEATEQKEYIENEENDGVDDDEYLSNSRPTLSNTEHSTKKKYKSSNVASNEENIDFLNASSKDFNRQNSEDSVETIPPSTAPTEEISTNENIETYNEGGTSKPINQDLNTVSINQESESVSNSLTPTMSSTTTKETTKHKNSTTVISSLLRNTKFNSLGEAITSPTTTKAPIIITKQTKTESSIKFGKLSTVKLPHRPSRRHLTSFPDEEKFDRSQKLMKVDNQDDSYCPRQFQDWITKSNDEKLFSNEQELSIFKRTWCKRDRQDHCRPKNLEGPLIVRRQIMNLDWIYKNELRFVQKGGWFMPANCRTDHHTAILIPFRKREHHLPVLLRQLHAILRRQQIHYRIFVIEQSDTHSFNRAKLFNVGFKEALRYFPYNCYVFHDVDLVPENDRISYNCRQSPSHLSVAVDTMAYELPYKKIFGGVASMSKDHFELLNGYSNAFWTWGGEDDNMSHRIRTNGLTIHRQSANIARYTMLTHKEAEREDVDDRVSFLEKSYEYLKTDGLNSLRYNVLRRADGQLFTRIKVDLLKDEEKSFK